MNIAIIGSRTFSDYKLLVEKINAIISEENKNDFSNITIISGGAGGADALGKKYAKEFNLNYVEHEAKWKDLSHSDARIKTNAYGQYDANAGHRRNTLIINDSDIVVAFHNGSAGTADSLRKAYKAGKKVYEYKF